MPEPIREFCQCNILRPLLRQMRGGVTPRRLAWSLALAIVIGINPSVGITTVLLQSCNQPLCDHMTYDSDAKYAGQHISWFFLQYPLGAMACH